MVLTNNKTKTGLEVGDFVRARGRQWLVEGTDSCNGDLTPLSLSCIDDDAQGEPLDVLWEAEVDARRIGDNDWINIAKHGADEPQVFGAFLRTLGWNTASASDRNLFQAPFRAGIRLDAYQLLPLRKALHLPRVNLLIADDVGLGKTIEAGLILRELLLRRRIDIVLVVAPPSMTIQWQDELEQKFGLSFTIIDRERLTSMRRTNGFLVNPWRTGSRFILSHRLMNDETYVAGLRDILGDFLPRTLLILDEAHHAAPASGTRYAIDSQFTKAVRDLASRFEHRLFLTATPHNGHSNSFSSLLEMLDPQRFTRGVEIRPTDLQPVMVRRLKSDLRRLGEAFPARNVEQIRIDDLPVDAPELVLAEKLAAYGQVREKRISQLSARKAAQARILFVGLQQRLLSSITAFAKTLRKHRISLQRIVDGDYQVKASVSAAETFIKINSADDQAQLGLENEMASTILEVDGDISLDAATSLGATDATADQIVVELAAVNEMLVIADQFAIKPDARVRWLADWIRKNLLSGLEWNSRRLIIFTEYEDTRRWLTRRLREIVADTHLADDRIGVFSGPTGKDQREAIKQAFNANPENEPLRILVCTDAAREGINLQTRCYDLVHFDLPWNPSRLEQRNGRIDRKLQPAKHVNCRYFFYAQRPEDVVLEALVRKTEIIRLELGAIGRVIETRISDRLNSGGIERGEARALAAELKSQDDMEWLQRARAEMDDEQQARYQRLVKEQDELRKSLERARKRVGVDSDELQRVVGIALDRVNVDMASVRTKNVGPVSTFRLDPEHGAFTADPTWSSAFDDLRIRRRRRGERFAEWRQNSPVRAISFEPPIEADQSNAENVVQVHLEHRLVRRLLSGFLSHGFQSDLNRACVILGPGAQPRVILIGRLLLYGPKAARLHEEIIPITADWTEVERDMKPLKPFGETGEETTLFQLDKALLNARMPSEMIVKRVTEWATKDVADLRPELERRAELKIDKATQDLLVQGEREAKSIRELLQAQYKRIQKADKDYEPNQLNLPGIAEDERRQRESDRRHWVNKLQRLEHEAEKEPERVREGYRVRAHRLEPVGLVYLWPASG